MTNKPASRDPITHSRAAAAAWRSCTRPTWDVSFWRLLVARGLGSPAGRLSAPFYRSYMQPPTFILWSNASDDAMGGFVLGPEPGSGAWWRFEFNDDVRARLRATVRDWNDQSINVLGLLGMIVTAFNFVTQSAARPSYARDTILMRGDNMSTLQWVPKCRGGKEPRSGALLRLLGCLEVGSG